MDAQNSTQAKSFKNLVYQYRAPLIVLGVILGAVTLDYAFRHTDKSYYTRGLDYMAASKHDAAIKEFSKSLRQNAADPSARFGLGWAYHSKGWMDEALKQYDMAAKSAADTLYLAHFNSGVIHQQSRQLSEALQSYKRALAVSPDASGANFNLGFVYADQGQNDLALQQFLKTTKVEPKNASARYNAGLMYERLGKKEEAKKQYQAALSVDPNFSGAVEKLKTMGN